jgi:DivIVA domain-containing protein
MPLTPEDVQNKRFTVVRFKPGYDEEEVDNFLDEIEGELRRLLGENSTLKQTAATAAAAPPAPIAPVAPAAPAAPTPPPPPPPPPPAEDPNETALRTLLLAQRTADDAIAQAHAEAEGIVSAAREKAASLENEAQAAHVSRVASLEQERASLEREITTLRAFEKEFRTRLKAYLESQLNDLAARATVAPAPPVGATTPPPMPGEPPSPAPPAPGIPNLAPPANSAPSGAPVPPVAPRPAAPAPGPFSAAPTPGTPAFGARPPQSESDAPTPPSAVPTSPVSSIDTDVDAGSDAPTGPPAEAADVDTDPAGE